MRSSPHRSRVSWSRSTAVAVSSNSAPSTPPATRWRHAPTTRPTSGTSRTGSPSTAASRRSILTNPYDDAAVVDLMFATEAGESTPARVPGLHDPPAVGRDDPDRRTRCARRTGDRRPGRRRAWPAGRRPRPALPRRRTARLRRVARRAGAARPVVVRRRRSGRRHHRDRSRSTTRPTTTSRSTSCSSASRSTPATATSTPIDVPAHQVVVYDPAADAERSAARRVATPSVFSTLADPVGGRRADPHPTGRRLRGDIGRPGCPAANRRLRRLPVAHLGIGPSDPARTPSWSTTSTTSMARSRSRPSVRVVRLPVASLTDLPIGAGQVITIDLVDPDVLDRN